MKKTILFSIITFAFMSVASANIILVGQTESLELSSLEKSYYGDIFQVSVLVNEEDSTFSIVMNSRSNCLEGNVCSALAPHNETIELKIKEIRVQDSNCGIEQESYFAELKDESVHLTAQLISSSFCGGDTKLILQTKTLNKNQETFSLRSEFLLISAKTLPIIPALAFYSGLKKGIINLPRKPILIIE